MIELTKGKTIKMIIVGVGGTGSHLVSFLTQLIGNDKNLKTNVSLTLIDGDIVEEHNLTTQKFLQSDVTCKKASVLADRYNAIYDMNINYMDEYVEKGEQIVEIIMRDRCDKTIIVGCVDNNKARRVISDAFNIADINTDFIYIDAGNSASDEELNGQAIVAYKKILTILPLPAEYFSLEDEEVKEVSCGERLLSDIQNIGANITSACTIFNILNNIIKFNTIPGDVFTFNATDVNAQSLKINKDKIKNNSFLNRIKK